MSITHVNLYQSKKNRSL